MIAASQFRRAPRGLSGLGTPGGLGFALPGLDVLGSGLLQLGGAAWQGYSTYEKMQRDNDMADLARDKFEAEQAALAAARAEQARLQQLQAQLAAQQQAQATAAYLAQQNAANQRASAPAGGGITTTHVLIGLALAGGGLLILKRKRR